MVGVVHTDNRQDFAEALQVTLSLVLLIFKLLGVAHILKLTSAALFVNGADIFVCDNRLAHKVSS